MLKELLAFFKMGYGGYRFYSPIPFTGLGIKFARPGKTNVWPVFFAGVTMNLLERKRYKYYGKGKPMKNWGKVWTASATYELCPVYFTCGLFSIVRHLNVAASADTVSTAPHGHRSLTRDTRLRNYGYDKKGRLCQLDYGDFNVDKYTWDNVGNMDYQ